MPAPIKGSSGGAEINDVAITWLGSWEMTVENNSEDIGPHIGDANLYPVETGQKGSFKVAGTIPQDTDNGQDAVFAAVVSRTNPKLELWATKGKKVTFAATTTVYKKLTIKLEANGTHTFEAEGEGPFTLEDGPLS
jgi:hypothetical protein